MLLRQCGWTPAYKEYPPFYKTVRVYVAELDKTFVGEIVMVGNRICIPKPINGYLDLDNYWGVYWRLENLDK